MSSHGTLDQALEDAGTSLAAADPRRPGWREAVALFKRPQPVTVPMVTLFAIVPVYLFLDRWMVGRTLYQPTLFLDSLVPLQPAWSVVYGSLFLAAFLPAFVVHQHELVRRTILAFLMVWLVSYAIFLAYPTLSPRPREVVGDGFFPWALRVIYDSDVDVNCFPSLHVAQCFVAALACYRVNRGVGIAAWFWAFAVGLSTVYTKQHYVADVLGGMFLAYVAYFLVLRKFPRDAVPEVERRLAPALALGAVGVYGAALTGLWVLYATGAT